MGWDDETDVVAIGLGAAGAATAIAAADAGAEVVVLEKQPRDGHVPSTRMSGGIVMTVNDVASAVPYLDACAGGMVPVDVTTAWAEEASTLLDWLRSLEPSMRWSHVGHGEFPDLAGADSVDAYRSGSAPDRLDFSGRPGGQLYDLLLGQIDGRRRVRVRWNAPACRLLTDAGGTVTGVETSDGTRVRARRGVVLTCGGYEFDERMKLDFLRAYPMHFYGSPANTGDGVRMAQSVGASLWHMNQMTGRAIGSFPSEDGQARRNFILRLGEPGYVIVDRDGRRFADEHDQAILTHTFYFDLLHFDGRRGRYPRIPSYWVFDERRRRAGPLTVSDLGLSAVGLYDWSHDNRTEIGAGWIHQGGTVEEAARSAGVEDPSATAATVRAYNRACASGEEDTFGRPPATMVALDEPPFYCVPLWPGGANTSGGPRRDRRARVLDPDDRPIPGLYSAGELGQALGLRYPADGANLSDALCFGRIAARTALEG